MSSREPTLADVAQLAGVSPTTVSRELMLAFLSLIPL